MKTSRLLGFLLPCVLLAGPGIADDGKHAPSAAHVKGAVSCHDCHQEEDPAKPAVTSDSCMACHGDLPAVADLTKALPVNPHTMPKTKPHEGIGCTDCHKQHKAPVVKCLECHATFKLKAK